MEKEKTAQRMPQKIAVEKGKTYFWCTCGLSEKQPFCDGSHKKELRLGPFKYIATASEEIFFCVCKLTKNPPFCDGSHSKP